MICLCVYEIYVCGERGKKRERQRENDLELFTEYAFRLKNKDEESILSYCVGSWQKTLIVSVFEASAYILPLRNWSAQ